MPRHGSEFYEERERDYYPASSVGGRGARVAEYDEVDIRERRRTRDREPEFLREDYARSAAGPLVLKEEREEFDDTRSRRSGRKGNKVESKEEVIIAKSGRDRPRGKESEFEREEIIYRGKERPKKERPLEREKVEEEIVYRPRERSPPMIARETEEFIYKPRERSPPRNIRERERWMYSPRSSEPNIGREEIIIKDRKAEREPERSVYDREEIIIKDRKAEREPERSVYDREEITIRDRREEREPERPVERSFREEDIVFRRGEREIPRPKERYERDELVIRREERSKSTERPRTEANFERDDIIIRRGDRERPRERDFRDEEIIIRRDEQERERPREREFRDEEIIIRRDEQERERPREREFRDEEVIIRRGERERERPREKEYRDEEIIIRKDERERPREVNREEIIIRRNERTPEPEPEPEPEPVIFEPPPIRAPPIHQEIITHHRHIDHGFENRAPMVIPTPPPPRVRTPPPPRSPSPKSVYDEIEIRRRGERNGKAYDDDIIIENRRKESVSRPPPSRRRSMSAGGRSEAASRFETPSRFEPSRSRFRDEIDEEAEFYARRNNERAYIGEAYNGATKDWAIVDVPPGTNRVKMDGIGGASQEVTWQRYNGVRRSNFMAEGEVYGREIETRREIEEPSPRGLDRGRRFVAEKPKTEAMWTEITKDLVVKEAIEAMGYEFEETEYFYYVMEYLRYEDVLRLVEISEDLKRDRRDRIRQIEFEQRVEKERPKKPLAIAAPPLPPWDEERVFEREVIYDRPPPPPSAGRREVRERTYVLR